VGANSARLATARAATSPVHDGAGALSFSG